MLRPGLSHEAKATFAVLQAWLAERWARDGRTAAEAGRALLDRNAWTLITGTSRRDTALDRLRDLRAIVEIAVSPVVLDRGVPEIDGGTGLERWGNDRGTRRERIAIDWPKYAEYQGMSDLERAKSRPSAPSPSPAPEEKRIQASVSNEARALAEQLLASLARSREQGGPDRGFQAPRGLEPWAREIARIQARPEEIARAIAWLFSPANGGEYRYVVHSGKSLREKYSKVVAAMNKGRPALVTSRPSGPDPVLAERRAEEQRTFAQLHAEGVIDAPTRESFESARASGKLAEAIRANKEQR